MVELDGSIDPLSVTARSVVVTREDGRPLTVQVTSSGARLQVEVEVGPALLADRPSEIHLRLAGLPSVHALATRDGRRLARSTVLIHTIVRDLDPLGAAPVRLERVADHALPPPDPLPVTGILRLVFDGVLDPATLRPEDCALWPMQAGLVLEPPFQPGVDWRCTGSRFELRLDLSGAEDLLQLDLRRLGILDLSGARPEPPLVVKLLAS